MDPTTSARERPASARPALWASVLVLGLIVYAWERITGPSDENKMAGETIVVGVEAFKQREGRYPERLEELVPGYLHEIPQAGEFFLIVYAADAGGKQCWVAYQVHRDRFEEYDCRKRQWRNVEFEQSEALKHPRAQRLVPTLWRR